MFTMHVFVNATYKNVVLFIMAVKRKLRIDSTAIDVVVNMKRLTRSSLRAYLELREIPEAAVSKLSSLRSL